MTYQHPDVVIKYITTKNKVRKLATYKSDTCALKARHEEINRFISDRFVPSKFAKGYVKKRSIYHNAKAHMYNDVFVMMDIKDFFLQICHKQLSEKLFYELNLIEQNQISKKECKQIVEECSLGSRGLPLGFITSPILSNVYLKEFDGIFYGSLKKLGLSNMIYTRYADDITVSFRYSALGNNEEYYKQIQCLAERLLSRYGLRLNSRKTRTYDLNTSNHVRVTGINIVKCEDGTRKLTVGRSAKNALFWDALNCLENSNQNRILHVKGMQSFVLSIEKNGYESCYSQAMMEKVYATGAKSLKELIDSL